jgi:hypothetical protein
MTIPTSLERVNYDGPDGCIATGQHREIIQSVGATRTLLPEESWALCLNDRAAGIVWTLPTPKEGMEFEFGTTVQRTSNSYKVITNSASVFLVGAVMAGDPTIATSGDIFTADGTTHVAITLDGDTKGGFVGERYIFTAISSTQWYVRGLVIGTGTMVTPFTTS